MDCGTAGDLFCRISNWVGGFGIDLMQWRPVLDQLGTSLSAFFWWIVDLAQKHGEKLFGLAGFSFGVWRWWYYRESVLHKRLQEYLTEQDQRLRHARSDVIEAIMRPGPKRQFTDPLFVVPPLRRVLRRRRWHALIGVGTVETQADRSLDRALREIDRRLGIAVGALTSLRSQMASAYLLKGAIASARASRVRDVFRRTDLDDRALIQFRTALQVHDYERDVQAKEYEAHQLLRLGHLAAADAAYAQLEAFTAWISDDRTRNLTLARAKKCRAQIAQAEAISACAAGLQATTRSPGAIALMNGATGALALRAPFAPFRTWDALEQGEMHYVSAFVCHHWGAVQQEPTQLSFADTTFRQILNQTPSSWFMNNGARRLRASAQAGLDRVVKARSKEGYETEWLLPRSNEPQQPPAAVGNTGG